MLGKGWCYVFSQTKISIQTSYAQNCVSVIEVFGYAGVKDDFHAPWFLLSIQRLCCLSTPFILRNLGLRLSCSHHFWAGESLSLRLMIRFVVVAWIITCKRLPGAYGAVNLFCITGQYPRLFVLYDVKLICFIQMKSYSQIGLKWHTY